jgi:hypothetical protein
MFILTLKKKDLIHHNFSHSKPWFSNVWIQSNQRVVLHFESLKQPLKHWTNGSGWEMVESMHNIILSSIKIIV